MKTMIRILPALAAIGLVATTPSVGAPSLSLRNSFRIGNGGVLCTAQSKPLTPNLKSMFDRGYSIVCRDAATPVGQINVMRKGIDDPVARVAKNRDAGIACEAPAPAQIEGLSGATVAACVEKESGLAYQSWVWSDSRTTYVVEGLAGYESALKLALRTAAADAPVKGDVEVATTSAGDPAAFARAQAGSLDSESALAEAYSRNNDGSYAEAAEFFQALVERDASGTETNARTAEYLANQALQESNQKNFAAAETLFARASTPAALGEPITGRLLRNFYAIHQLNEGKVDKAIAELDKPVVSVKAVGTADAALASGAITPAVADRINRDNQSLAQMGGSVDASLQPFERAAILDAQALQLQGVAYRIKNDFPKARAKFDDSIAAMGSVREGKLNSTGWLRSSIQSEQGLMAEKEGRIPEAQRMFEDALTTVEIGHPQTAIALAAKARFAGFLARHGQGDRAMTMFAEVVKEGQNVPGALTSTRNLLSPYFALLAQRAPSDPTAVDAMFQASQVMLRPGIAQTQALLARELSGGDDEAASLFRQTVALTREIARTTGEIARMTSTPNPDEKDVLLAAQKRLARSERDQTALQSQLNKYPRYRVLAPETMSVAELQKSLRPSEAYFKVTMVQQDVYGMFVTPDEARAYRIPATTKQLDDAVAKIRDSVVKIENGQMATYPFDIRLARRLYLALLGPVDAQVHAAKNFIYEPDGPLLQLPANLLPSEQAGVDAYTARLKARNADEYDFRGIAWLGRDHDVSTVVSPRSFADGRTTSASRAKMAYLGLGENAKPGDNPFFVPPPALNDDCAWPVDNWNNPISSSELYLAANIIGTDKSALITDGQFSDTAIEGKSDLNDFRVIHFATHGLVTAPKPSCPARPALLTSFGGGTSDGLLSFKEIFDLKLDADVVVLSACDTAGMATVGATREAGVTTGGNFALDGLVRAFVGAGARTVIASHWPVPDDYDATKRLISGLFTAPPGTAIAAALREAQIGLMDDANTSHPYYWSAFAIVGDGERPMLPANEQPAQQVTSTGGAPATASRR
ncbi:CHAT domain-containing protein [Sphingomonas montanisoli]|nr:CHAT domain-containing protein [Sphingomonas montanisoli]